MPPSVAIRIYGPWVALLGALVAFPFVAGESAARTGSFVAVYALVALSLTVLTGWAGAVSLGHAAFVGLGAFLAAYLTRHGVPFAAWIPAAVAASLPAGLLTGLAAGGRAGPYFAVATLALGLAVSSLVLVPLESDGVTQVARPRLAEVDFGDERLFFLVVVAVVATGFGAVLRIGRSRTGRALLAVRESDTGAAAVGVGPVRYRTLALLVSGALATTAGVLLGVLTGTLRADQFTPYTSIAYLAAAVAGGLGSVPGAVAAGAVQQLAFEVAPRFAPLVLAVLLLAAVVARPDGLAGLSRQLVTGRRPARPRPARASGLAFRRRAAASAGDFTLERFEPPPGALAELSAYRPPDADGDGAADSTGDGAGAPSVPAALEVRSVSVEAGPLRPLDDVSVRLEPGEIVGIAGPAGSGKTALLDVCSGFLAPSTGRVLLDGGDITAVRAAARVRAGLVRTFSTPQLVAGLTVCENLLAGAHSRIRYGLPAEIIGFSYAVRDELAERERVGRLLDALGLSALAARAAGDLPPGQQRLVEVARALAAEPSVLLLDEPSAGLDPSETAWIAGVVSAAAGELGVAVAVAERDLALIADVADYTYVLDAGRIVAAGRPEDVSADARVAGLALKPAGRG